MKTLLENMAFPKMTIAALLKSLLSSPGHGQDIERDINLVCLFYILQGLNVYFFINTFILIK